MQCLHFYILIVCWYAISKLLFFCGLVNVSHINKNIVFLSKGKVQNVAGYCPRRNGTLLFTFFRERVNRHNISHTNCIIVEFLRPVTSDGHQIMRHVCFSDDTWQSQIMTSKTPITCTVITTCITLVLCHFITHRPSW